jgi:hypothetical protein
MSIQVLSDELSARNPSDNNRLPLGDFSDDGEPLSDMWNDLIELWNSTGLILIY